MPRSHAYCPKPSTHTQQLIEEAPYKPFFVVQEVGPTAFVVTGESSQRKFRVAIGGTNSCSCQLRGAEPCEHTLFVLLKVFRVPRENPLVWQLGLVESEIADLMKGKLRSVMGGVGPRAVRAGGSPGRGQAPFPLVEKAAAAAAPEKKAVARRDPAGDVCSICYDDFVAGADLTFCADSCGANVHVTCMKRWADHRIGRHEPVTCPMCRAAWGMPTWIKRAPDMGRMLPPPDHPGATCSTCRSSRISGALFRCDVCVELTLCVRCFGDGAHGMHPFCSRALPAHDWAPAERPEPPAGGAAAAGAGSGGGGTTLSLEVLLTLPTATAPVRGADCEAVSSCGVCSGRVGQGALMRILSCGHAFHSRCADSHLTTSSDCCPTCSERVTAETCARFGSRMPPI